MRKMIIPALVTLLCPFFPSACVDDESVELRASREPDRRYFYGERMGSTSTAGEEPPGETEASTSGDTDDMPIADTDGCPWWGCNGLPGNNWSEIITDCSYPDGHPEVGEAQCPSPKHCVSLYDFDPWLVNAPIPYVTGDGETAAFCTLQCPIISDGDSCLLLEKEWQWDYETGVNCATPDPEPGAPAYCMSFMSGLPNTGFWPVYVYGGGNVYPSEIEMYLDPNVPEWP